MVLLHVYTDGAEESYNPEPAQKACRRSHGELPRGNLLFRQTVAKRGMDVSAWVG